MAASELSFRAMGSDCTVIVVGGRPGMAESARRRIADLEGKWSRFIDESEISRLNRAGGRPTTVSPETLELIERSLDAWRISGGAFDPTVLGSVIRAGYDRSFEQLGGRSGWSRLRFGAAELAVHGDEVTVPEGVGFDPGGIGKGLAADRVVAEMTGLGAEGICVNMGGDVRVKGTGPDPAAEGWTVSVLHPWREEPMALLGIGPAGGAVATSTTLKRRWAVAGEERHHLIDPQTGLPSDSDLNLASVVAGEAWAAEVLAKAVLLRGSDHPFDTLGGTGAEGLAVDVAGRVQRTAGLAAFLGAADLPARIPPA